MSDTLLKPKPYMVSIIGNRVEVKLKWGIELRGDLASFDGYMNLKLDNTEEYVDGVNKGNLGEVVVRSNNILYIRGIKEEKDGEI